MITSISGYQFTSIADPVPIKATLLHFCLLHQIKGTILLANEGINIMLAGEAAAIDAFVLFLNEETPFKNIGFKYTESLAYPFKKCCIKIKKEIVTMGQPALKMEKGQGTHLPPETLKQWFDEKKDFVLIDTRNDYEYAMGTFEGAMHLDIHHFRDFPDKVAALDPTLKDQEIVLVCTGGIRCEKAAPYMIEQGFKHIYQLDGGILMYFKNCQGAHYHGDCFVFDEREAVNINLEAVDDKGESSKAA